MNKRFIKIFINILIFLLIAGFGYYMVHSIMSDGKEIQQGETDADNTFISPYIKINSLNTSSKVLCFNIYRNGIYAALSNKISVFDLSCKHQYDFRIKPEVRDIIVEDSTIYLLYPAGIELYSLEGEKKGGWEACSDNSDYCSFTTTNDYVFVTDAENKNICQYNKQGQLVRFIKSPQGFIIPSYSFGIVNINDTIYCSNSGRYKIESYTIDGKFIASFGKSGVQAGEFAGCCNPVYLEKTSKGNILLLKKESLVFHVMAEMGNFALFYSIAKH